MRIAARLVLLALAAAYAAFWVWYGGDGKPLSAEERAAYAAELDARFSGRDMAGDDVVESLKRLIASDDGKEFYMVNLIKFRETAAYPSDHPLADETDARAADARYTAGIVPLLLKRAGHPIFAGPVSGRFLEAEGARTDWDMVGVVRYRSRRDLIEMVLDPEMKGLAVHKAASIEATHVFPAEPAISLFPVRMIVLLVVLLAGLLVLPLARRQ